ncbi:MAG: Coenzyme F420 hydrogenase/dehydrogenase, beta subunit C-terminal domain [Chloroflexi bacterium]|nr:Coenzyme F420 hydrogenase/dehydrogenase, beta subunit C-terminal domain [Chloroflexota bacterium]
METSKTIDPVVRQGLCTGCGTCAAICSAIAMLVDHRKGIYVPQIDKAGCNECGLCFEVCPGRSVDFARLSSSVFGRPAEDSLMGHYLGCYTGHATNHDIRYNSASGGMITALLVFALEKGLIDGALVTRMSPARPLEPEPVIATSREGIIAAAKSKYCPVPANIAVKQILEQSGRYAVAGLPCHIHGIRKAELRNKKLRDRIALHLGIVCSHTDSFRMTDLVLRKYKVNKDDIAGLHYRGEGWPGSMSIQLKDGSRQLVPLHDYIVYHRFGFFTPRRCVFCLDRNADLADISSGDAWLPDISARDKVGTSLVVSRSEAGRALLEQAVAGNYIQLEERDARTLRQGAAGKRRRAGYRLRLSRLFGRPVPEDNPGPLPPEFDDRLWGSLNLLNVMVSSSPFLRRFVDSLLRLEQPVATWLSKAASHALDRRG